MVDNTNENLAAEATNLIAFKNSYEDVVDAKIMEKEGKLYANDVVIDFRYSKVN